MCQLCDCLHVAIYGDKWQKSEYGYDRKVWYKKVVSAVYAVKHIASVSSTEALKMQEEKRVATTKTSGKVTWVSVKLKTSPCPN